MKKEMNIEKLANDNIMVPEELLVSLLPELKTVNHG